MKLGVSITAFREDDVVESIKQYEGIADRILVSCPKKSWFNGYDNDDTAKRARTTSATVHEYHLGLEHDQRNWLMDQMRDLDYVITAHCDTWFTRKDLGKLKEMDLDELHYNCEVHTYWKDTETTIYPCLGLPTILVRSDAKFSNIINIEDQVADPTTLPIVCYHTSWLKTDEQVETKINAYSHAGEIRPEWFEEVWKGWKPNMTNFAPTTPHDYKETRKHPLPEEIKARLSWKK